MAGGRIILSEEYGVNPSMGQCKLCAGDTNELFLLGKLPGDKEAPLKMALTICDECKEMMGHGFLMIGVRDGETGDNPYRNGMKIVIKVEAAEKIFNNIDTSKQRCAFVEENVIHILFPDGVPEVDNIHRENS